MILKYLHSTRLMGMWNLKNIPSDTILEDTNHVHSNDSEFTNQGWKKGIFKNSEKWTDWV